LLLLLLFRKATWMIELNTNKHFQNEYLYVHLNLIGSKEVY